jgi:hypothetical protein
MLAVEGEAMAAVPRTVSFRGQKLARQATSTTEDAYTLSLPAPSAGGFSALNGMGVVFVQLLPTTAGILYHTTATAAAADGFPIAAGQSFTVPVTLGTPFYIVAAAGTGTLDMVVL